MSRFHTLTVKEVKRETPDAVSVAFDVPDGLQEQFKFIQGQYLTIRVTVNGEVLNRSYSICSSPYNDEPLTVAIKKVEDGRVSTYMNETLKAGDQLEVMEPMGNFHTKLNPEHNKHYILFGGGSGITPMMSIIKSVLHMEPNCKLTLFYGNRDEQSIIFREKLNYLESDVASGRLKVVNILDQPGESWEGYRGMMKHDAVLKLLREQTDLNFSNAEIFICGPSPMMAEVKAALEALMIPKEKVHIEYFTAKEEGAGESATIGGGDEAQDDFNGTAKVKITYDGESFEFEMNESDTVLEAALDAGYDPPYACMVAACCTCRAKLNTGKVEMEDREALTDEEIEEGYVLTCQSHPKSSVVDLNYDE